MTSIPMTLSVLEGHLLLES